MITTVMLDWRAAYALASRPALDACCAYHDALALCDRPGPGPWSEATGEIRDLAQCSVEFCASVKFILWPL